MRVPEKTAAYIRRMYPIRTAKKIAKDLEVDLLLVKNYVRYHKVTKAVQQFPPGFITRKSRYVPVKDGPRPRNWERNLEEFYGKCRYEVLFNQLKLSPGEREIYDSLT
jgi:hypothetical protein